MPATLAELVTRAKRRADMVNSNFLSPTEWQQLVNDAYRELYDMLVIAFEDYFIATTTIPVVSGTDTYPLQAAFYKMLRVRLETGSDKVRLPRVPFIEDTAQLGYCILGQSIMLKPEPTASGLIRYWYVPQAATLSDTVDVHPGVVNGWEQYAVVEAARVALEIQKIDTSSLEREKLMLSRRIATASKNRDAGEPQRVRDVQEFDDDSQVAGRFPWGS